KSPACRSAGLEFISSDGQFRQVDDAVNDGILQSKLLHNVSRPLRQPRWGHKGPGHVAARSNTSLGDCPAALGTFPFQECRDPNTAWTGSEKLIFLVSYAAFWLSICMIVYFWPRMSQLASRCTKRSRAATATTIDGIPRVGLLSEAGAELAGGLVDPCAGPMPPYPTERRLIELFEDRVKENPAAVALTVPGSTRPSKEITYGALNAAIDEVTDALLSCGITRGSVVALVLDRSVAQVVAVFGVLKAGAAFLPVDNDAPFARKQFLLLESESSALIAAQGDQPAVELASEVGLNFIALPTDGSLSTIQIQRLAGMRANSLVRQPSSPGGGIVSTGPVERIRPEASDMALLIYTSGTTGSPKGIVYDHQHLMHGVHFFATHCKMNSSSVGLLKSPYFWAIIEWEMFPALTLGGKLVVASASGHKSPDYLANTIAAEEVSVLMITPQVLDLVLDVHEAQGNARPLRSLKHIVTVGEPLTSALANRTVRMGRGLEAQLHNFYGASESSCTVYTVPKEGVDLSAFPTKAPAGLPQPHSKVYVMKVEELGGGAPPLLTPVSAGGEAGEICFGGVLAACYWKHDELTSQKWIDTQEYGRLYMTGDRGRWHHGVLEVVGRVDRQVKIRGVRVEPEEVEAVLKKFSAPVVEDLAALSSVDIEMELAAEGIPARNALKEVAVVASQEPSDLVAFVSIREGVGQVTSEALRAHCQANLTPSYVPKFIVILEDLPKLPNGKPNLRELSSMASEHVVEEGEMVMDSLGQMKKLSKWAVFENAVIHRCYAWWMIGVLTDHYMRCAIDQDENTQFYPFCTTLARSSVKPWAEIIIRSIGNDQDLFGFIMLGAYQDSRPAIPGGPAKVNLGLKDLFVFVIYVAMALPIAQGMHLVFGSWAWPIDWGSHGAPTNEWDYNYMEVNSYTSDHRWYLAMVLSARVYLEIMEKFRAPAWLQGALATIPCFIDPPEGHEYAFDVCEDFNAGHPNDIPMYVRFTFSWMFRNFGTGCAVYWKWVSWYLAFYVWCFHFLRPAVARAEKLLPKGPTWAAAALGLSMMIGVLMAMFHYPNNVLENGTGLEWAWLEIGVDIIQVLELQNALSQTCACFVAAIPEGSLQDQRTQLRDRSCSQVANAVMSVNHDLAWATIQQVWLQCCSCLAFASPSLPSSDPPGFHTNGICVLLSPRMLRFQGSMSDPASAVKLARHYLLLSPTLLYQRLKRLAAARRAREALTCIHKHRIDSFIISSSMRVTLKLFRFWSLAKIMTSISKITLCVSSAGGRLLCGLSPWWPGVEGVVTLSRVAKSFSGHHELHSSTTSCFGLDFVQHSGISALSVPVPVVMHRRKEDVGENVMSAEVQRCMKVSQARVLKLLPQIALLRLTLKAFKVFLILALVISVCHDCAASVRFLKKSRRGQLWPVSVGASDAAMRLLEACRDGEGLAGVGNADLRVATLISPGQAEGKIVEVASLPCGELAAALVAFSAAQGKADPGDTCSPKTALGEVARKVFAAQLEQRLFEVCPRRGTGPCGEQPLRRSLLRNSTGPLFGARERSPPCRSRGRRLAASASGAVEQDAREDRLLPAPARPRADFRGRRSGLSRGITESRSPSSDGIVFAAEFVGNARPLLMTPPRTPLAGLTEARQQRQPRRRLSVKSPGRPEDVASRPLPDSTAPLPAGSAIGASPNSAESPRTAPLRRLSVKSQGPQKRKGAFLEIVLEGVPAEAAIEEGFYPCPSALLLPRSSGVRAEVPNADSHRADRSKANIGTRNVNCGASSNLRIDGNSCPLSGAKRPVPSATTTGSPPQKRRRSLCTSFVS
ncbi:unnamed protein product, partial [Polarella glacialis]